MRDKITTMIGVEDALSKPGTTRPTLCVLHGPEPGRIYPLTPGTTLLGRSDHAAVIVDSHGVSRRHAAILFYGGRVAVSDLGSTNGTRVNGERLVTEMHYLEEGDRVQIGDAVFKFAYQDELEADVQQALYASAVRDKLTGVYNRAYFNERCEQAFSHSIRSATPLSLALFDLDHFKHINDTYGHPAGDAVLKAVAKTLQAGVRREDTVARYGGEELVVLLPDATLTDAKGIVDRICDAVARLRVRVGPRELTVTISAGVAERLGSSFPTPQALLARADSLLYEAKAAGRNCARAA